MIKKVYLDYQATVPIRPEVLQRMNDVSTDIGNPNSTHSFGRKNAATIYNAKNVLADFLGVSSKDIFFTSGATESIEIALLGVVKKILPNLPKKDWNIITTPIEHKAVLNTIAEIISDHPNIQVRYLQLDQEGQIKPESLEALIDEHTLLVSVMYANNEIGTIFPIRKLGKIIRLHRSKHKSDYPVFHTDATQSLMYLNSKVDYLGVDMMTFSAHKIGGPLGIGALYVSPDAPTMRIRNGNPKESFFSRGTTSPTLVAGFARAIELISKLEIEKTVHLQRHLWSKLSNFPGILLNGPAIGEHRLPCNLNISTGIPALEMLLRLDLEGVAVSAGSACSSRSIDPSHVISAIYDDHSRVHSALRISFGYATTIEELDFFVKILSNNNIS